MTRFIAALLTACAVASAGAASAQTARIPYGDLDLATTDGARAFDARVQTAARNFCRHAHRPLSRLSDRTACERAVRDEALQNLPEQVQVRYAAATALPDGMSALPSPRAQLPIRNRIRSS